MTTRFLEFEAASCHSCRMEARAVSLALLLLTGCAAEVDDAVPTHSDIQRVEERLMRHPCVGDLDQWERNYRFARKTGLLSPLSWNPDLNVIELHMRRVGTINIRPGSYAWKPRHAEDWPDSRSIQSIDGRFNLANNALSLSRCQLMTAR